MSSFFENKTHNTYNIPYKTMAFRSNILSNSSKTPKPVAKYLLHAEDDVDDDESESKYIRVVENVIYFFADVDTKTILTVTLALSKLIKEMQFVGIAYGIEPPPITIYINSDGGEVHSALSLYDFIRNSTVEIITVITGNACSAATIISLAGHKRKITENSYMLIHNISSSFWGKMHEFEDEMKNMGMLTENLNKIYKENGKINKRTIESLLKKDLLLDANTCLSYGFVDEIVA